MRAMNLPNFLTLARILLIPVFLAFYMIPGEGTHLAASVLFALAAFTDWLDGYLFALSGPIYAGTNEVQRNIIAERILGLPKD